MEDSILNTIKKLLGIDSEYTHFDTDIVMHINSVFSILCQLGVGPADGFMINGEDETWSDFIPDLTNQFELIKTYVYYRVRQAFDPPTSSSASESLNRLISEAEWRINAHFDY